VDLEGQVVGDGGEEGVVVGVEGDVVYDGRVGSVDCRCLDFGTGALETCNVPAVRWEPDG
jgi:hypothetical protein